LGEVVRWTGGAEALAGGSPKIRDGPDKYFPFDKRGSACVRGQKRRMEWSGEEIY
jgi:hypothetical protein